MESNFLVFNLQREKGPVFIKPGEIVQFSTSPDDKGSRIVTRQKQLYYVEESLEEIDDMIVDYFSKMKGDY